VNTAARTNNAINIRVIYPPTVVYLFIVLKMQVITTFFTDPNVHVKWQLTSVNIYKNCIFIVFNKSAQQAIIL
jgi:hypothetical protein